MTYSRLQSSCAKAVLVQEAATALRMPKYQIADVMRHLGLWTFLSGVNAAMTTKHWAQVREFINGHSRQNGNVPTRIRQFTPMSNRTNSPEHCFELPRAA
jgi:hypothetical protein